VEQVSFEPEAGMKHSSIHPFILKSDKEPIRFIHILGSVNDIFENLSTPFPFGLICFVVLVRRKRGESS